jgi:hypothetical protein
MDIESEIGADDRTAVASLVSQDDEWSAQVTSSMRISVYKLYFIDDLQIAILSYVLSACLWGTQLVHPCIGGTFEISYDAARPV